MKNSDLKQKSQGSLEYLIIISTVLVIASIVVVLVTGTLGGREKEYLISECRSAASQCESELLVAPAAQCTYCDDPCGELEERWGEEFPDAVDHCKAGNPEKIGVHLSDFQVTITHVNTPITEGETIETTVQVNNTGQEEDTQTITLGISAIGWVDTWEVTLGVNESDERTFTENTEIGDRGTYTLEASSENDEDETNVEIKELEQDEGQLTTVSISGDDELYVDEESTWTAEWSYSGDTPADANLEISSDDDSVICDWSVSTESGETRECSGSFNSEGTYTITASCTGSCSEIETIEVTVEEEEEEEGHLTFNNLDGDSSLEPGETGDWGASWTYSGDTTAGVYLNLDADEACTAEDHLSTTSDESLSCSGSFDSEGTYTIEASCSGDCSGGDTMNVEVGWPECEPGETEECENCCYDRYCDRDSCESDYLCNGGTRECQDDGTWGSCDASSPLCRSECSSDSDCSDNGDECGGCGDELICCDCDGSYLCVVDCPGGCPQ